MKINHLRMLYKWSGLVVVANVLLVVYDHFWNRHAWQTPLLIVLAALFITLALLLLVEVDDPNPRHRRPRSAPESTLYGDQ